MKKVGKEHSTRQLWTITQQQKYEEQLLGSSFVRRASYRPKFGHYKDTVT
jgi:hypothetical protein